MKFRGKKVVQVFKKSHSSFNNYENDENVKQNKKNTVPIF